MASTPILTLNQIQLANHIESKRNGWMTLAQDGLTSKKVYARVTKMKFERRALCCVCVQKQRASLFYLDIISCHSAPQHLVPSGLRVCKTRWGKGPHGVSLHIQLGSAPAGPSHLQPDSRSSRATPRRRHARVDGRSCAGLQKIDNVCPIAKSPAKKKTARLTLKMQQHSPRARSDALKIIFATVPALPSMWPVTSDHVHSCREWRNRSSPGSGSASLSCPQLVRLA